MYIFTANKFKKQTDSRERTCTHLRCPLSSRTGFTPGAMHEFLAEAEEQLEKITTSLSTQDPSANDPESIHSLYRELHTLKGNAQLFGCQGIAQVAHTLESSIDSTRKKGEGLYPELADEVYTGIGLLERMVRAQKNGKNARMTIRKVA